MPSHLKALNEQVARHRNCEEGAISILNLYFIMAMAMMGGIAVDVSNLVVAKKVSNVSHPQFVY